MRNRPICETSNSPTPPRVARCSVTIDEYWTGISQPAKSTRRAPFAACQSCSGVLRRSAVTARRPSTTRRQSRLFQFKLPTRRLPRRCGVPAQVCPRALSTAGGVNASGNQRIRDGTKAGKLSMAPAMIVWRRSVPYGSNRRPAISPVSNIASQLVRLPSDHRFAARLPFRRTSDPMATMSRRAGNQSRFRSFL